MKTWLVMICGGLLTYATRLSFIVLLGKIEIPAWLQRSLRFVPPAVLSAIIFPELLLHTGNLDFSFHNARLLAGLLATLVAWRTRNTLLTILVGMVALLVLQGIFKL
jgi:branched chain amino acid efflux pump